MSDLGFDIIPGVLSSAEIDVLDSGLAAWPVKRSRAGVRHLLACPAVASIARDPRLLAIARRVLGADALPFGATLFDKSAEANWLVVWHQDTALPLRERRDAPGWGPWSTKEGVTYAHAPASALSRVVALRIHLDDSTEMNGPLRVLPGSHTLGVLSDPEIQNLAGEVPAHACVAPSGSIVMMRPLLVHASSKVASPAARRVIHIEYASSFAMDGLEVGASVAE
jgi:ectoine hydroxylase-related dioxygenase (phytanoyl-CoA dioxygenase family)